MKDYIFILCDEDAITSIRVYETTTPFDLLMVIPLEEIYRPRYLVSSAASECLYVTDGYSECIWNITIEGQATKWLCSLCNLTYTFGVTVSTDGQVVVLRGRLYKRTLTQFVEIYTPNAVFIRRIHLSNHVITDNAILKPDGQLIIVYVSSYRNLYVTWVISLVNTNGEVISHVNLTSYYSNETCWSFGSDATQLNDSVVRYKSYCTTHPRNAYLLLEGNIIPLFWPTWCGNGADRYNLILADVQVAFGIHSSKNNLQIHASELKRAYSENCYRYLL